MKADAHLIAHGLKRIRWIKTAFTQRLRIHVRLLRALVSAPNRPPASALRRRNRQRASPRSALFVHSHSHLRAATTHVPDALHNTLTLPLHPSPYIPRRRAPIDTPPIWI